MTERKFYYPIGRKKVAIVGEVYNVGGNNEKANIEIVKLILSRMGKDESLITHVKDRPGHDRRYAIDSSKLRRELGWKPIHTDFDEGLRDTIAWYEGNRDWWEDAKQATEAKYAKQGQ